MSKEKRSAWFRCLAYLLMVVVLSGSVGYMPEAKAASQYSTGFYMPIDGLQRSTGHSGFIPNRVISESGNTVAHLAQDYISTSSWNVMAIYEGTVLKVRTSLSDDSGRYIILKHTIGGKTVYSIYQHLQSISVQTGQNVSGGQVIGVAGTSGKKDGQYKRHLHLAIYSGTQDAWAPRLTSYSQNAVANGPITYNGTTYYNPERVFSGASVIGDGSYLGYSVIDSTARIGVSTKPNSGEDQCYVKETPFEDSSNKSDSVPQGSVVNIVGAVKNKYGNIWYKTADGGFIWEGDVAVYEYSNLFTLSANFQNKKDQNSHVVPYVDSDSIKAYPAGNSFKVKAFVVNSYGNIWAELADGGYMNFYDKDDDLLNMEFVSHVTAPAISGETKPTGDINVTNQGFWLKGTVTAEVPFLTLSTRIINRETGMDMEGRSPASVNGNNAKSITISKDNDKNDLDSLTKFTNLPKGWYQFQLNAQFGFTYAGRTFKLGGVHNFITSDFTVGNPGILSTEVPPLGDEEPPLGDVSERVPGDANEDGSADIFDALLVLQYDAGWDVEINTANADVNADGIADIFDALTLLQYDAGWDIVLQ